jgi:hypothetical protein
LVAGKSVSVVRLAGELTITAPPPMFFVSVHSKGG